MIQMNLVFIKFLFSGPGVAGNAHPTHFIQYIDLNKYVIYSESIYHFFRTIRHIN